MPSLKLIISELKKYSKLLNEKTNKSSFITMMDMIACGLKFGASPANYFKFDFYNKKADYRASFVTNKINSKLISKYNQKNFIPEFENKVSFMRKFKAYTKRDFIVYPECSKEKYITFIKNNPKFIAKPLYGSQGQGIQVFENAPHFSLILEQLGMGRYIFEEFISQHKELDAFYDKSVNCIRVITVLMDGKTNLLVSNITFGLEKEIANASDGGIICEIDLDTGIIISDGGQYGHRIYNDHPYSGKKFKGYQIPYWIELKKMLDDACREVPEISYVGWDLAITPAGPVIIEGNTSPGYTYFQIPQLLPHGKGVMEKYKDFI